MCGRNAVRFFVRVHKNDAVILTYYKEFLCAMTEKIRPKEVPLGYKFMTYKVVRRALCGVALKVCSRSSVG